MKIIEFENKVLILYPEKNSYFLFIPLDQHQNLRKIYIKIGSSFHFLDIEDSYENFFLKEEEYLYKNIKVRFIKLPQVSYFSPEFDKLEGKPLKDEFLKISEIYIHIPLIENMEYLSEKFNLKKIISSFYNYSFILTSENIIHFIKIY